MQIMKNVNDLYNIKKVKIDYGSAQKRSMIYKRKKMKLGIEKERLMLDHCLQANEKYQSKNYFNHVYHNDDGELKLVPSSEVKDFFKNLKITLTTLVTSATRPNLVKRVEKEYQNAKYFRIVGNNYAKIDTVNKEVPVRFKDNFSYLVD